MASGETLTRAAAVRRGGLMLWGSHRRATIALLALSAVDAIVFGLGLVLLDHALGRLFDAGSVLTAGVPLVVLVGVQQAAAAGRETLETLVRQETSAEVNSLVLTRVRAVPFEQISDNRWQGDVGLVLREASYRPGALVENAVSTVTAVAALVGIFAGAVAVLGPLVLVLPLVAAPALFVESRLQNSLIDVQTASSPLLLRMQFLAQMSIDADWQRDVRAAGSPILEEEYRRLADRYLDRLRAVVIRTAARRAIVGMGVGIALVIGGLALARQVTDGRAPDPGTVAILLGVIGLGARYVSSLVYAAGELFGSAEYLRILFSFLDTAAGAPAPVAVSPAAVSAGSQIHLRNLRYRYPGQRRFALDGISAVVPLGLTAISGPNGAGKTTLVKIMAGLLEPDSGEAVARSPHGSVEWRSVRRAVLFQDSSHLRLTVRQNVTLMSAGGEDEKVWAALRAAGLGEVVDRLPEGLDTVVGAGFGGAADLSGGQWQRLAVSRAFYRDAPLLICDEPTANLDARAEHDVYQRLRELAAGRTVVLITHRMASVRDADRIYVLDHGAIVEEGDHSSLMASGGIYAQLFTLQASAYQSA